MKELKFNSDARNKLKDGLDQLADAVKITLGPKGRLVVIENKYGAPHITKDGVTVAKNINLPNPFENIGAQMVKEVASKTGSDAGDGTTTATVLAQAIVNIGLKNVTAGANPMDLKRGIDKAVKAVVKHIKSQSKVIGDDFNEIEQVATISANSDSEIGKLITNAMREVTKNGVITIEESKSTETTVEVVKGMQFNRGLLSSYFTTDKHSLVCELHDAYILIFNGKINHFKEIVDVLEKTIDDKKSILLISDDIDKDVLANLLVNKVQGQLRVSAVRTPGFADLKTEMLEDLAILTGGTVIGGNHNVGLDEFTMDMLGSADKVITDKENTIIVGGNGDKNIIANRIAAIEAQIEKAPNRYEKTKLRERLAKLTGGIAIMHVGANSEVEMKEKVDRVDDALSATKAAIEEGFVPGGGVAYIRALKSLVKLKGNNEDENIGIDIIRKAIESPLRQILMNTGLDSSMIVQRVKDGVGDFGYDAAIDKYTNLCEAGIIDPTKVSRVALENAASIAGMFLTTECVMTYIDRTEKESIT